MLNIGNKNNCSSIYEKKKIAKIQNPFGSYHDPKIQLKNN